jgi:hypothetical protein
MKTVVIQRGAWNSGGRLNPDGHLFTPFGEFDSLGDVQYGDTDCYCCLGFLGLACGLSDEDMEGLPLPSGVKATWPKELFDHSGHTVSGIGDALWESVFAALNDHEDVDHATRESWISEGFRIVLGVECEFVGEYEEPES